MSETAKSETTTSLKKFQKELNSGTVSLVLLALLEQASEAMYGYQISKRLESLARGAVMMKQGTLYPVLRSLEGQGLLRSEVEPSVSGPPRRYYTITPMGREELQRWSAMWKANRDFVESVLNNETSTEGSHHA